MRIEENQKLASVLNLERNKGYNNEAVFGGINRFIEIWSKTVANRVKTRDLKQRLDKLLDGGIDYKNWDIPDRKQWIAGFDQWLIDFDNQKINSDTSVRKHPAQNKVDIIRSTDSKLVNVDSPVTEIKGIKSAFASKLNKLGIKTIRDLIYYFPRYHLDYTQNKTVSDLAANVLESSENESQTIIASVWESNIVRLGHRGIKATEVVFGDETGNASAIWYNQPYLARQFVTNSKIVISGKYKIFKGRVVFQSPDWDLYETDFIHAGRLVPVYSLTGGLYQKQIRNLVKRTTDLWCDSLADFLPPGIRADSKLVDLSAAIKQSHFPEDQSKKESANERLAFDELFLIHLGMLIRKSKWQSDQPGNPMEMARIKLAACLSSLPFKLTAAQTRVLDEILEDMKRQKPMSRLLQGEVGSGKTILAIMALLVSIYSGYQGAFMAPTELLAEQHYNNFRSYFSKTSAKITEQENCFAVEEMFDKTINIALLLGKTSEKVKSQINQKITSGEIDVVIGTHALIQKGVEFKMLGMVVIDEQHRFGVVQRNLLRQKGYNPHVLVMTATPIPRTLALTVYGDLDISILNELPPGRQVIKTRWIAPGDRDGAYKFVKKQILEGNQAFVVCPLIEESRNIEAKAATVEYERLSQHIFPDLKLGLLHGKMKPDDKEQVMADFRDKKYDILVSTPVVEVGIDIPNATVIMIEAADRFGLSQLHQFRGRVGRGQKQSYCLLLTENPTIQGRERMKLIESIQNGFELAEKDLELRGPGEFFGVRQSGLPDLQMANIFDIDLIEKTRKVARSVFEQDPGLSQNHNKLLLSELRRIWPKDAEWS